MIWTTEGMIGWIVAAVLFYPMLALVACLVVAVLHDRASNDDEP